MITGLELRITNLRPPIFTVLVPENKQLEFFEKRIRLALVEDETVLALTASSKRKALTTVSANMFFANDLTEYLASKIGESVDLEDCVFRLIDLLSFATRRGVSFRNPRMWRGKGHPIVRGECDVRRLLKLDTDYIRLIETGLPRLLSKDYRENLMIGTALRWFLGGASTDYNEMRYMRLYVVLEMLANRYCDMNTHTKPPKSSRVVHYMQAMGISQDESVGTALNDLRSSIVHGDSDRQFKEKAKKFAPNVLQSSAVFQQLFPDHPYPPNPESSNDCLIEATEFLKGQIEQLFIKLLME